MLSCQSRLPLILNIESMPKSDDLDHRILKSIFFRSDFTYSDCMSRGIRFRHQKKTNLKLGIEPHRKQAISYKQRNFW